MQAVYLSPHLDDAALSCGGLIHQQAQQRVRPLVITCFAGVPDYRTLSPFATMQHQRWGKTVNPTECRRREDAMAMACLGAEYEHWEYLDCIYRRHPNNGEFLYADEEALFSTIADVDCHLIDELAARLKRLPSAGRALLYAPLAVGQHVDHQLVFRAVLKARSDGLQVWFYEDYPYAENHQKLVQALQLWTVPPMPIVYALGEEDIETKIAAIQLYSSQLSVLFGDEATVSSRIRMRALAVGGGQSYGERYWKDGVW